MGLGISFHFQNVVLLRNVFSLSKCERFREFFFPFWVTKICTVTTNSFTDEVVKQNIYKAFKFVSMS